MYRKQKFEPWLLLYSPFLLLFLPHSFFSSFFFLLHTGFIKNCSSRRIVKSNRRIFWKSKALSPFPRKSLKTSLEILCIKPCWDAFSYCLIAKFFSRSCGKKNAAYIYLYLVSKHFFFELTGILVNYDQLLTLLHNARVVTCGWPNIAKSENIIIIGKDSRKQEFF